MQKQNFCQGGFVPKNRQYNRKTKYPDKVTKPKCLVFVRIFLFSSVGIKIQYFPTAPSILFLQRTDIITPHFLTCFLALIIYRYLEKFLEHKYTCEEIPKTLKDFNFAYIKGQGFIPLYKRTELTDKLHEICHFNTDFEFITKSQMRTIQKQSKGK